MKVCLAFLLFMCSLHVGAQQPLLINFSKNEGLVSNEIHDLAFDKDGRLWLATDMGVSSFDGYEIKNYSTPNGLAAFPVYEIFKDANNKLWCVSSSGKLSVIENSKITPYKYNEKLIHFKKSINIPHADFYVDDKNNIAFSFQGAGKIYIDSDGNTEVKKIKKNQGDGRYQTIEPINDSVYFFAAYPKKKSAEYNLKVTTEFILNGYAHILEGKRSVLSYDFYNYLLVEGKLLISLNEMLYVFEKGKLTKSIQMEVPIIDMTLIEDNIWFAMHKNGVIVRKIDELENIASQDQFLGKQIVTKIVADQNNGIWISTVEHGLYYMPNIHFRHLNTSTGLISQNISSITYNNQMIYAGSYNGYVQVLNSKKVFSTYRIPYNEPNPVKSITVSNNHILTQVKNNLVVINQEGKAIEIGCQFAPAQNYHCFVKDFEIGPNNEIYLSGKHVFTVDEEFNPKVIFGDDSTLVYYEQIYPITENQILLGTIGGLYMLNNNVLEFLGKKDPLLKFHIAEIEKINEQQVLLATVGQGILIYDFESNQTYPISFEKFPKGIGINDLFSDKKNSCWVASNVGLFHLEFKEQIKKTVVRKFSKLHGLSSVQIEKLTVNADTIYLATDNGITIIPKKFLFSTSYNSKVVIEQIEVNGKEVNPDSLGDLNHDQNRISINYKAIDIRGGKDIRYKYRLKGIDGEWQKSNMLNVNYNGLPPGKYTFEIHSIELENENPIITSIPFSINPPFWNTWWFICIEILFGLSIVTLVIYQRGNVLKKRANLEIRLNKEKSEMEVLALRAQMNPHFIFNTFGSIQYLIHSNQNEKAEYFLEKFSRMLRRVVDQSLEMRITLLEEVEMLRTYLDLQNLRFENKFELIFEADESLNMDKIMIPGMIIQPFIENAIEHGLSKKDGKGILKLSIELKDKQLLINIKDDGIGRENAKKFKKDKGYVHHSIGLSNVQKRLSLLEDESNMGLNQVNVIDLKDSEGNPTGTLVELRLIV